MKKIVIGILFSGILCIILGIFIFIYQTKENHSNLNNIMQIKLNILVDETKLKTISVDVDQNFQKITITEPNTTYQECYFLDYDKQQIYFLMDSTYPSKKFSDMNISDNILDIFELISSAEKVTKVNDLTKKYTLNTDMVIAEITSANNYLKILPSLKDFDSNNIIEAIVYENQEKIQKIDLTVDRIKMNFEVSYDETKRLKIPNEIKS